MSFCNDGYPLDKETVVEWCCRDRDRLSEKMMIQYPHLQGQPPAFWVEDLIMSLCQFRVYDRPLPRGQLGLCDMANKVVLMNSEMNKFVHHKTNLVALRRSTLAHELGHIQLHQGEFDSQFVSHHETYAQSRDPRAFQKEMEADLYAAIFLVPKEWLLQHHHAQGLIRARADGRPMNSSFIWKAVYRLAYVFGVSPTMMRRCLIEFGWIERLRDRDGGRQNLRLRMERGEDF